jgi:hypothetical protein
MHLDKKTISVVEAKIHILFAESIFLNKFAKFVRRSTVKHKIRSLENKLNET